MSSISQRKKSFNGTGNSLVIDVLNSWGINRFVGTNGGGLIHFAEYLEPFTSLDEAYDAAPRFFTLPEHLAGFFPLGHFWATGRMAAVGLTTGGAFFYGMPGYVGSWMHNTPGVWIAALSPSGLEGKIPLQYTERGGFNTIGVAESIAGTDGYFVIESLDGLEGLMAKLQRRLRESNPAILLYRPNILSQYVKEFEVPWEDKPKVVNRDQLSDFLSEFPNEARGRDVVILVGEEAARYPIKDLITQLAVTLQAPVVYNLNSANAVSQNNPMLAGHVYLGFNDFAFKTMEGLTKETVMIWLGFDPGEYESNQKIFPASVVHHFTDFNNPYGSVNDSFEHRVDGAYRQIKGPLDVVLREIVPVLRERVSNRPALYVPDNLNVGTHNPPSPNYVDIFAFFQKYHELIKPDTLIFDDVCIAYKDRQRAAPRPRDDVERKCEHRGSTMGGTAGMLAAKISNPERPIHAFAGDGCFEYFGAALARLKDFGVTLWVMNNGTHAIVDTGLDQIKAYLPRSRHHSIVPSIDYSKFADAVGWDSDSVKPDLSNLPQIMDRAYSGSRKSLLVQVTVDPYQVVGTNARLLNLQKQGQRPNHITL